MVLLTLLIFDDQIKKLIKYENFFKELQILGDFDNISSEQKISFIKIPKGSRLLKDSVSITQRDLNYIL